LKAKPWNYNLFHGGFWLNGGGWKVTYLQRKVGEGGA